MMASEGVLSSNFCHIWHFTMGWDACSMKQLFLSYNEKIITRQLSDHMICLILMSFASFNA